MAGASTTPTIHTIGHSTRTLEELVGLLADASIELLADVRTVPRSRRHPHFAAEALGRSLPARGIAYSHEPALGGFRRPQPGSPNRGWREPAFVGYADHMESEEFNAALTALSDRAVKRPTCVMCAEAQWWRCHRRLLADALTVRGWRVLHLGLGRAPIVHELTPFALPGSDGQLSYPPAQGELALGGP